MVLTLPSSQCQWRHLQPSQGAARVPALGRDLGISARIGDLRHPQNSQRFQKSYSAQGNTHPSRLESSEVPDKFYSAVIHASEPKPNAAFPGNSPRARNAPELPLLLLSAFPISTSQREEGNLPVSFSQASPFQPVPQDLPESWDEAEAADPFCLLPTRRFPGDNHTQQPVGSRARAPSAPSVPTHPRKISSHRH